MNADAPSYAALLRDNANFRRLWFGVLVSFFGDWFSTIALYTLVQELTGSAQAIAAVMIAKTLPIFAMSGVAGPLIDRFDRRALLIGSDLVRAVLTLGIVAGFELRSLPVVFAFLVARVAAAGVFLPARTAVLPQLTSPRELPVAMALNAGTWSVMLALGAAAGGVVTEWVGIRGALLFDGCTFVASAVLLWPLPALPPRAEGDARPATLVEGLRFLRGRVYLPAVLLTKSGLALASGSLVTIPLFGAGVFAATSGPLWMGLLYASRGLGALVGSVGVRKVSGDRSAALQRSLPLLLLLTGANMLWLGWAPSIGWVAAAFFLSAVGNGGVWVFSGILGQRATPRSYRGRMFALEWGLMTLVSAGASWATGFALDAEWLTVREAAMVGGSVLALPAAAWVVVLWLAPDIELGSQQH